MFYSTLISSLASFSEKEVSTIFLRESFYKSHLILVNVKSPIKQIYYSDILHIIVLPYEKSYYALAVVRQSQHAQTVSSYSFYSFWFLSLLVRLREPVKSGSLVILLVQYFARTCLVYFYHEPALSTYTLTFILQRTDCTGLVWNFLFVYSENFNSGQL